MTAGDVLALLVFLAAAVLFLGKMFRESRRLHGARPRLSEPPTQPRRYVMPPPEAVTKRSAPPAAPARRAAPPKRRPAPATLEARVLRNRRLSPAARLVVASEIMSPPKALRRKR